ncbi:MULTISPECIES: TetR family transcriptional regulator C-terminal domain-containing protein [Corynebacterium]|uniref:TetR family transcriptional regulator C-terminal domain-containing protein n=1 Tax=Corynebacterium TaxID=1716 RepID=UPI003FCF423E
MPKIVDHGARRDVIGWAVAQLIAEQGVHAVTVRAVAAVAGYQPSTLRHYFPNSDQMLAHALIVVRERQKQRLATIVWPSDMRTAFREGWLQALPVDADRLTETHVWLAVSLTARSDVARRILAEINEGLDQLCNATVEALTSPDKQAATALALRAFTDGLALGAIAQPERFTPQRITESLDFYLTSIHNNGTRLGT